MKNRNWAMDSMNLTLVLFYTLFHTLSLVWYNGTRQMLLASINIQMAGRTIKWQNDEGDDEE